MLLPALNKAKEKVHEINCTNNLKQIGLAFIMYANDHEGWVVPYDSGNRYWYKQSPTGLLQLYLNEKGIGYIGSSFYIYCSSHLKNTDLPSYEYSYGYNRWFIENRITGVFRPVKADKCRHPSATMFTGDHGKGHRTFYPGYAGYASFIHSGGGNYLFLDGHVKWEKFGNIEVLDYKADFWNPEVD